MLVDALSGGCDGALNEHELWGCAALQLEGICAVKIGAMQPPVKRSRLRVAFEIGVILKGLNGLLELIGGTLLLFFPQSAIQRIVVELTHNELSRQAQTFAAIYLLSHGVIKAVLVYALLKDKLWAFPWAIGVFAGFGVYQIYRYFVEPSGWLIALTVLDVIVIVLTSFEWQRLKQERQM